MPAGFALSVPSFLPSIEYTRMSPVQSEAMIRSLLKVQRSARSANASVAMICLPVASHTFAILSRPQLTMRPSGVKSTHSAPPACATQLRISVPSFTFHSAIFPSSLALASTPGMNASAVHATLWPASVLNGFGSAPDSHTSTPPLRSAVARYFPSGLYAIAVIHSVCFLISPVCLPSFVLKIFTCLFGPPSATNC